MSFKKINNFIGGGAMFLFIALPPMPEIPTIPPIVMPQMSEASSASAVVTETGGGSVSVSNSVRTESNTGGNVAEGGQVVEGKSKSSIEIKTVVNGEVVEDFHEEVENGAIEIVKENIIATSSLKVETKVKVSAGGTQNKSGTSSEIAVKEVEEDGSTSTEPIILEEKKSVTSKIKNIFSEITNYVFSLFTFWN